MKLNDPFGRVNHKHHRGYLVLRDRLHQQGITDPVSAAKVVSGMSRAAMLMLVAIVAFGFLIVLTLPDLRGVVWVLGSLLTIWVGGNYFYARMHLKRYMLEECHVDETMGAASQDNQTKGEHS